MSFSPFRILAFLDSPTPYAFPLPASFFLTFPELKLASGRMGFFDKLPALRARNPITRSPRAGQNGMQMRKLQMAVAVLFVLAKFALADHVQEHGRHEHHSEGGDIVIGKIDDHCDDLDIDAKGGSVIIENKIDNWCNVKISAKSEVKIGTRDDKKICNHCNVTIVAEGDVYIGSIDNWCNVTVTSKHGKIVVGGEIQNHVTVRWSASGGFSSGNVKDGSDVKQI